LSEISPDPFLKASIISPVPSNLDMSIVLASPLSEGENSVVKPAIPAIERNGLPTPRAMSSTPFFFRLARPQGIVPKAARLDVCREGAVDLWTIFHG
jgi:hypothetical protein